MSTDPSIKRILIIDDHVLFADGLALILGSLGHQYEIVIASDAFEVLSDKFELQKFDLVLIDLHMPNFNGFGFLTAVQTQKLSVDVAVISGTEKKNEVERAISLGAQGFIPKDSDSEEMLKAVAQLLDGQRYLPDHWVGKVDWITPDLNKTIKPSQLTSRQLQVLELMSDGMQNKQIAAVLGLSVSSVKGHVELLFKHLGVNNRTACVQTARDARVI